MPPMDHSLNSHAGHQTHTVAPDGWCFDCGAWAVPPDPKLALQDAQRWLDCVKSRQDPTTRLMRRLAACLELTLAENIMRKAGVWGGE